MLTRYPPAGIVHAGRGIGSYAKQLAAALAEAGWSVTIIADARPGEPAEYVESGVRVLREWRTGVWSYADISRAIKRERPSIIHIQHETFAFGRRFGALLPPLLVRMLSRIAPVITSIHGVIPATDFDRSLTTDYAGVVPRRLVRAVYAKTISSVIRNSDVIHVLSPEVLRSLQGYGSPKAWMIVPHGISPMVSRIRRKDALQRLGLPDARRAVFLGFLLPYKGLDTLEAAAPLLKKNGIEVLVAGGESGDDLPTHTARGRRLDPAVRRIGFVPEGQLPALFAIADVMVFPHNVGLAVSGPLALAAGYGVPVVVSNVPTLAGLLACPEATFSVGDPIGLTQAVIRVLTDATVRTAVQRRLLNLKIEHAWANVAAEFGRVYLQLLDGMEPMGLASIGNGFERVGATGNER
jgi:glycosyltransferase involved in cell wall biosynthesis